MRTSLYPIDEYHSHGDWDESRLLNEDKADRLLPMTVCIAAYCEEGKSVVVAADRSVSYEGKAIADGPDGKLIKIASHAVLAASGTPLGRDFLAQFKERELSGLEIKAVAAKVRECACGLQRESADQAARLLTSHKYKTAAELFDACVDNGNSKTLHDALAKCSATPSPTKFFVAGAKPSGVGLWVIDEFAKLSPRDSPGFIAIGAGKDYAALTLFARAACIKSMPVEQAVFHVYEAKKTAELTPGVKFGGDTDMAVIRPESGVRFLSRKAIGRLEAIRKKMLPPQLSTKESESIQRILANKTS